MSIKASFDDTGRMNMLQFTCLGFPSELFSVVHTFLISLLLEFLWYALDSIANFFILPFCHPFQARLPLVLAIFTHFCVFLPLRYLNK